MKGEVLKSLKSQSAGIEEKKELALATVLDPTFKDRFFAGNIVKATVKENSDEGNEQFYKTGNPYTWQGQNSEQFPVLSKLAQHYLCFLQKDYSHQQVTCMTIREFYHP